MSRRGDYPPQNPPGTSLKYFLTPGIHVIAHFPSVQVDDMRQIPEVGNVHDLHVWSITSGMYALSV